MECFEVADNHVRTVETYKRSIVLILTALRPSGLPRPPRRRRDDPPERGVSYSRQREKP